MSLGIYIGSRIKSEGLLHRLPKRSAVYSKIRSACDIAINDALLRSLLAISIENETLLIHIHPAEEPVRFEYKENGLLVCEAKTSSAGPGYHAFLVGVLDSIGASLNLNWQWESEDEEFLDETEYGLHRDFKKLQKEMVAFLRQLARSIIKDGKECNQWQLSLPLSMERIKTDFFAISSLGFWEHEWFERMAESNASDESSLGAMFYPWWEKELDARFWKDFGLVLAWVELPWHVPVDEEEAQLYKKALACFDRARELDPSIDLPEKEINEMRLFLNSDAERFIKPGDLGVGFHRRPMVRPLTDGWSVALPGYYYKEISEDKNTVSYGFGTREVHGTSFTARKKDGEGMSMEEILSVRSEGLIESTEVIKIEKDHLAGLATISLKQEEGGSSFVLSGKVAMTGKFLFLTIYFEDVKDKEWAIETWHSAYHEK